jgi:signal transduction histidine kinase
LGIMKILDRLADRAGAALNLGLALVLAAVLAREAYDLALYGTSWPFDVAVALVTGTAALARSRGLARAATTGVAVCAAAEVAARLWPLPGQPAGAAALALLVLTGASVRRLPAGPAVLIATAGLVIGVTSYVHDPARTSYVMATRIAGLGWGVAVAVGLGLRFADARREARMAEVRRAERLELARELHDAAAHHLTGIVIQAQAARIAARKPGQGAALDGALEGIEGAGTAALASLSRVIGLLRDPGDAAGLSPGPEELSDLVGRFAGRGSAVELRLPDGPADPAWPPEVTGTVSRVVAEALTNITRHAAGATQVTVTLAHDQRAITVQVTDNAPPASSPRFLPASGYGLTGMRERVEALGGTLRAGPGPGPGWSVHATLPAPGQ